MTFPTRRFEASEYIATPEAQDFFLRDALQHGDASEMADALLVVAQARGMTQLAAQMGMSREALYLLVNPLGGPQGEALRGLLEKLGLPPMSLNETTEAAA